MPIDPLIGSSLIGAGASVLGGIFGIGSQASANKTNLQVARENREWQEKMWNMQNAYNSPVNQLELYKQAGVNPLTALSEMNGNSSAGTVGTPNLPTVNPSDFSFLNQAGMQVVDGLLKKAQIDNINEDTYAKRTNNKYSDQRNQLEIQKLQKENDQIEAQNKNILAEYNNILKQGDKLVAETANLNESTEFTKHEDSRKDALQKKLEANYDAQIANLKEQTRLLGFNATTARISARASAQVAENGRKAIELEKQKWDVFQNLRLPYELAEHVENINLLVAQNKQADAIAELEKMRKDTEKDKPQWYKTFLGPNGMVTEMLHTVCDVVGTAASVYLQGKLGAAAVSNASSNARNASSNARNATVNEQRLQQPPSYGYSYGSTGSWNP